MHIDSSFSAVPSIGRTSLATRLGLVFVSVAISASLIGGLLGLFEQRADHAWVATAVAPAAPAPAVASLADCTWVANAATSHAE